MPAPLPARRSEGAPSSQQLNSLVEELSRGLRRILRKYRQLSAHLNSASSGPSGEAASASGGSGAAGDHAAARQQGGQHDAVARGGAVGQQEASSWAISAGRRGGASGAGAGAGSASEAMAEASAKAASIAAKLDRLLTPGTRAAVHGGGVAAHSRFAAEAAAEAEAEGAAAAVAGGDWQPQGPLSKELFWGLAADPSDEVPLRQRYAASTASSAHSGR